MKKLVRFICFVLIASTVMFGLNFYFSTNSDKDGKYGFTSYGLSFAAMPGSLYKTVTQRALKTQTPKLVVFEINGFLSSEKYLIYRRPVHAWFDTVGVDSDGRPFKLA